MKMAGKAIMSAMMPQGSMESFENFSFDGKRKKRNKASKKATLYNKRNICRGGIKCWDRKTE
jgi:DNA replication protein DnaC